MEQALLNQYVPYSQEAEEAVIGAVLINPPSFFSVASFLNAEDFFILRHQHIWQALLRLNERGDDIDYVSIGQELKNIGKLDEIGGYAYITQLITNTPTSIHAEVYGRLVERAAVRRRLLSAADRIKMLALDEELTVERVMDEAETELFGVSERQLTRELVPMREALSLYYDHLEGLMQAGAETIGLPAGFKDLDKLLGGLQKSDLLVFAGRPGMGKTSWLLSVALNVARLDRRVLIFTMEMGVDQIVQRMVSMESAINSQKLRVGNLTQQERSKFHQVVDNLSHFHIFIDDTPAMTPLQMRSKCFRLMREHGIDLVILDYMQLMNAGGSYENNRVQEISYISRSMKELARELNIPIISAAQLSRAVEQRQDKRPVLSDLRESGSIEQDADVVMFLYRDEVYNEATEFPNQAEIIVAKHRNGPTGTISLYFDKSLTKFLNAAERSIDLSHM
jgi:replicative DNA helicase